jgi:hypothetical protein
MENEVRPLVALAGDCATTTDGWRNKARKDLTTVNLHFINPETAEPVSINLQTMPIPAVSEDGQAIADNLLNAFTSVSQTLAQKVRYGAADRASNQQSGLNKLGLNSMFCNVHMLSTTVKHAIGSSEHALIKVLTDKSHAISLYIRNNATMAALFRSLQGAHPTWNKYLELIPHMDIRFLTIDITLERLLSVRVHNAKHASLLLITFITGQKVH